MVKAAPEAKDEKEETARAQQETVDVGDDVRGRLSVEVDKKLARGLHVFAEGSMWYFYPAIRNFHRGAASFAVRHKAPLVPLAISYRKTRGLYRVFKKYPNLTVHVGEPLFADEKLGHREAAENLTMRARLCVMNMVGIKDEKENQRIMDMYKNQ